MEMGLVARPVGVSLLVGVTVIMPVAMTMAASVVPIAIMVVPVIVSAGLMGLAAPVLVIVIVILAMIVVMSGFMVVFMFACHSSNPTLWLVPMIYCLSPIV